jgi:ectoine hydroxylase-related dioxygenase (phytanoyl-CoA dioxygenase family)
MSHAVHVSASDLQLLLADGGLRVPGLVPPQLLADINALMRSRAERVMHALGGRSIGIGSRAGFHELVQRSPGRFDVPLSEADLLPLFGPEGSLSPALPWMQIVHAVLGPDARPAFCGVVFSRPGSPAQQWHIDSPHEGPDFRPAHALNVMLALADIPLAAGPTQLAPGTHRLSNHLARPGLDHDDLVYQTAREITPADILGNPGYEAPLPEPMAAGDVLFFDDRLLHRGLGNSSASERWVAYFAYLRPRPGLEKVADTHFEASRSLFA